MMSMKEIVCTVSVRLAVSNERLLLWKKTNTNVHLKPLALQKQLINHFGIKVLSTTCELLQNGEEGDDSEWSLNLTDGFTIQSDIYAA